MCAYINTYLCMYLTYSPTCPCPSSWKNHVLAYLCRVVSVSLICICASWIVLMKASFSLHLHLY